MKSEKKKNKKISEISCRISFIIQTDCLLIGYKYYINERNRLRKFVYNHAGILLIM